VYTLYNMCEAVACLHRLFIVLLLLLFGTELLHCTATDWLICGSSHLLTSQLLLRGTFLGSFNAGTEVWRRREEYFAAEFEDVRGLRLAHVGGGGKCGYSVNNCQRCSGCESQGGRDTG
jgi:hypothetical protein